MYHNPSLRRTYQLTVEDSDKWSLHFRERDSMPPINIIDNWLVFPLPCVSQLCYADYATRVMEVIQELTFHLPPAVNGLRGKVCIPVKCNSFKGPYELFHQPISFSASITAGFDEVSDVLGIKLVEFGRLIAMRHTKCIDPLCIRFLIQESFMRIPS